MTLVSPTFLNVSATGSTFTLADLSTVGLDECWGDVNIQLLDEQGRTVVDSDGNQIFYFWQDNEDYDAPGWYDRNDEPVDVTSVTFDAGQALWIAGITDSGLQAAGEVNTSDVPVPLRAGMTPTGNPFPTTIKLSDIEVSGYAEGDCWGDVNIQLLDPQGRTVVDSDGNQIFYFWQDNEDYDTPGWYDRNDELVDAASVTFAAGQGMWVSGIEGTIMTFKVPKF